MKIDQQGLDLIKRFEGFSGKPYRDSVGVVTIGYGTTHYGTGRRVTLKDDTLTKRMASAILEDEVNTDYASKVDHYVSVDLTQNQFDALVSFTYNLGSGALRTSTLLKKLNKGKYNGASKEFLKWTHAGGKKLPGLVKRRKIEQKLFLA